MVGRGTVVTCMQANLAVPQRSSWLARGPGVDDCKSLAEQDWRPPGKLVHYWCRDNHFTDLRQHATREMSSSVGFYVLKIDSRTTNYNKVRMYYIHRVPKKTCDYIFYNNFNSKCPIAIIFGIVSGKSMCHQKMVSFPTSPI